jgi:hypothetical protein
MEAIASSIAEEDLRRSYLENVPSHRALRDAWSRTVRDNRPS